MFAIAFDLVVKEAERHHPKGDAVAAYADIRKTLQVQSINRSHSRMYRAAH